LLEASVPANDPELLAVRFGLAQTSVGLFRSAEALQRLEAAERAAGPQVLEETTELARRAWRARVEVLMDAQRPQEALAAALRLVALSDALAGSEDIGIRFEARQRLGEVYLRLGDRARADALAAELAQPPFGEAAVGDVLLARMRLRMGRERINEGKLDEAEAILTGVRDAMTRAFGPNELYAGGANLELIDVHATRGHFAKAAEAGRAAVAAFTTALGEQHNYTLNAMLSLGGVELEMREAATALRRFEAVRPFAVSDKNAEPLLAATDFGRARALIDLGRAGEALDLLATVNAEMLAESSWGPRDFQWQLQAEKGRALMSLGRRREAVAMLRAAVVEMERIGSYPWRIEGYRKLIRERRLASR
jgi:tetratricopeptide (TPR) repeat protein